jgi:hypothetical protein
MKIMKKLTLTFLFSLFALSQVFAGEGNEFTVDRSKIKKEMSNLNDLETYVNQHEGITAEEIKSEALVNPEMKNLAQILNEDLPLGIPSFWWGFGAGCVGAASFYGACWLGLGAVFFVYFMTDENKEEAKKALWGCLAGTAVGILLYFVVFTVLFGLEFYAF